MLILYSNAITALAVWLNILNYFADDKDIIFKSDDGSGGTENYIQIDGSEGRTLFNKHIRVNNSVEVQVGSDNDLKIYHDSSHSYIDQVGTGDLYIRQAVDDKDIIFQSDNGSGGVTTYFQIDGASEILQAHKDLYALDNIKLRVGNAGDLSLLHDGTHSYMYNNTGHLYIQNYTDDGDIYFQSDDGSGGTTTYIEIDGGSVATQFNKRALFVDNVNAEFGSGRDLKIYHDGSDSYIMNETGQLYILNKSDDKDIELQSDDGSGNLTTYIQLDGSEVSTKILTQKVIMSNLPTSDPSNAGQLWNDSGTLKISAG